MAIVGTKSCVFYEIRLIYLIKKEKGCKNTKKNDIIIVTATMALGRILKYYLFMEVIMGYQDVANGIGAMTCIVSVEKKEDGGYGEIRIVTGNKPYIDSIEHPAPGVEMLTQKFTPNSLYTEYMTRDLNFEQYCYQAAVLGKCLHSYAHPDRMPVWFNMTFLPVSPNQGNLYYCTYTMEINFQPDSAALSSSVNEKIAAEVLEACLKMRGASDFESALKDVLKDIRGMCQADYVAILSVDAYERSCKLMSEDASEKSALRSLNNYLNEDFCNLVFTWEDTIAGSNCIIAKDKNEMQVIKERNPVWYESLIKADIESIVLFPLKSRNHELLGYMWAVNFYNDDIISIKETLELTTFVLASEVGNYLILDRLKILSSRDMLTGVMNRNEMNNYVEKLSKSREDASRSVGVIFTDLNGLKHINDEEGHSSGDVLLKDSAKLLMEVFPLDVIYRAGGDEFTIILLDVSEEEIVSKINRVRELAVNYDRVEFAIGYHVEASANDIHKALKYADIDMYEDKRKFYEMHPEKKR